MFGDETTSDSVRPLSPPVSKSSAKKLIFFEPDRRSVTDETDPVIVEEPSLFPEPVFDPTATGAFPFDLAGPQERVAGVGDDSRSPDPSVTVEGSIIDLTEPDPPFSVPFTQAPSKPGDGDISLSTEGWLQRSLFSSNPTSSSFVSQPRTSTPESRSFLDRLNYGNIEDVEDVRWFHRPIIWLVFGLLTVSILFVALLMQDDVSSSAEVGRTMLTIFAR